MRPQNEAPGGHEGRRFGDEIKKTAAPGGAAGAL